LSIFTLCTKAPLKDDAAMHTPELVALAERYLLSTTGLSVPQLVRKIQLAQGNQDCFATGKRSCQQTQCPWRDDCLVPSDTDSQFPPAE
jgi:hypothetical protein